MKRFDNYDNFKKNFKGKKFIKKNENNNYTKFFLGLNEFKNLKLVKEEKKTSFNILKYAAIMILILGLGSFLFLSPYFYKRIIDKRYRMALYNDLIYSYADTIEDNIKVDQLNDDYLHSNELDPLAF